MSKSSILPEGWPKMVLPHVAILATALAILFAYFSPVTKNEVLYQTDLIQHRGMSKEIKEYRAKKGEEPLWGARMFSGMPTYQYGAEYSGHFFRPLDKIVKLSLPRPVEIFFTLFLGFYILLLTLKIDPWLAGIGALAFMLSSFFFVSIEAGHTSKINAVAYMAVVVAGVMTAYRGRILLGGALTALGMGLEVSANHFQITYYLMFMLAAIVLGRFIYDLRAKQLPQFAKASGILLLAMGVGIMANYGRVMTTYEYSKDTIRGAEILAKDDGKPKEKQIFEPRKKNGLKPNYAFQWSNGGVDLMTFLVPSVAGGASGDDIGANSETHEVLKRSFGKKAADQIVKRYPTYWGALPFTSGPVYAGSLILFLFVLGLIIVDNKYRWWILGITIFALMLSLGKNFLPISKFLFNYFPMYNKFRAPSMMLIVVEFTLPLLGILALRKFLQEGLDKEKLKKQLFIAAGSTGGVLLLLILAGSAFFSFSNGLEAGSLSNLLEQVGVDPKQMGEQKFMALIGELEGALISDRLSLFRMDALRSLAFILGGAGLLFAYLKGMIKQKQIVYAGIAILVLVDLWGVNRRYLNEENFVPKRQIDNMFKKSNADLKILSDPDPHYRVLNLGGNIFQEALTSYHHKSIGGYHAAKLRRYQDLVDEHLGGYVGTIGEVFNTAARAQQNPIPPVMGALRSMQMLHMLNCKYIIFNPKANPIENPYRLGNAWFVSNLKTASSPMDEITQLGSIDPSKTVVVSGKSAEELGSFSPQFDAAGSIKLTQFDQKHMIYESSANGEQFAVFSEIYYNSGKGWNAYIDGNPVDHYRVNYLLRGMKIPAGKHKIEFKFEPSSYYTGNVISLIFSLLAFIGIGGGIYLSLKKGEKEGGETTEEAA